MAKNGNPGFDFSDFVEISSDAVYNYDQKLLEAAARGAGLEWSREIKLIPKEEARRIISGGARARGSASGPHKLFRGRTSVEAFTEKMLERGVIVFLEVDGEVKAVKTRILLKPLVPHGVLKTPARHDGTRTPGDNRADRRHGR